MTTNTSALQSSFAAARPTANDAKALHMRVSHDLRRLCHIHRQRAARKQTIYASAQLEKTTAGVPQAQLQEVLELPRQSTQSADEDASGPTFVWSKHWYPVCLEANLSKEAPNKVTLLGRDYVVWHANGRWNAAKDECPHRFAPMSVGRVEEGELICRYHGWRFEGGQEGRCTACPQASDASAEVTVRESSRSRLEMHPSQVQQGLLWLWPESGRGAFAEAATQPPELTPQMADPGWAGSQGDFAFMENPASFQVMLENALDPSHASYVHNRVISRREDAAPMRMRLSSEVDPQRGFELEHGGYSKSQQEGGMRAKRWFVPPCTIRTEYTHDSGRTDLTTLYLVPVAPGVTRAYNKVVLQGVAPRTRSLFNFFAKLLGSSGLLHAFGHGLVDQDMHVLHPQERKLAAKARGWRDYYLATPSDAGVAAFWRWLSQHAGGDVQWADGVSPELPPQQSQEALLDHYERHTKHCPACQKAVRRLDQVSTGLAAAAAVLGGAALLALPPAAGFSVFGLFVQARVPVGAAALALLAVRSGVLKFRQRFFRADAVIG